MTRTAYAHMTLFNRTRLPSAVPDESPGGLCLRSNPAGGTGKVSVQHGDRGNNYAAAVDATWDHTFVRVFNGYDHEVSTVRLPPATCPIRP